MTVVRTRDRYTSWRATHESCCGIQPKPVTVPGFSVERVQQEQIGKGGRYRKIEATEGGRVLREPPRPRFRYENGRRKREIGLRFGMKLFDYGGLCWSDPHKQNIFFSAWRDLLTYECVLVHGHDEPIG